ncbi:MAG: metal ABC transporter ATP-binding protein [Acidimicrobiales bacterium]
MTTPLDHPLLRIAGVGVTYPGGHRALSDVTVSVGAGELVAVVGPNGAGKSTLFRAVAGLVEHDGQVEICGVHCHRHRDRLGAAFIPQRNDLDLDFPITVDQLTLSGRRRFLPMGRRPGPTHRRAARTTLERVGLGDLAGRPLGSLSGGQLQRALIARALAQEARLLMLDEALSGVDRARTEAIFDLFDRLTATGTSLLVSTHDLDLARRRFDRCLTINGRLVGDGHPSVVLDADGLVATFGTGMAA